MIESDIRTPPKLKEIIKEKKDENKTNDNKTEAPVKETTTQLPAVTVRNELLVDKIEANGKFELPDANERPASLSMDSSEGKASSSKKKEEEGTKGVAVPVIMDDLDAEPAQPPKKLQKIPEVPKPTKEEKKKVTAKPPKENPTTTPSSGLSTWILLSDNRETTTPSVKKSNKKDDDKKRVTTTKKPSKVQTTTPKTVKDDKGKTEASKQSSKNSSKKGSSTKTNSKKPDENLGMSALEEMVKNQKKSPTTGKPESNFNTKVSVQKKPTDSKKKPDKISERIDEAESKDKVEIELHDGKKTVTLPPMLNVGTENPTAMAMTDSSDSATTTENSQESTTEKKKKNKKKKNKNRRRKPSNKNATDVELKNNVQKNPKQPVGAQLYNFLSREIMPTVGLGLVGVLVTAGLAGLLGYNPFVAGNLPIRRTYESQHGYSPNNYYNYNTDYNDGGQSEEVLFREVLSGMPEESRYGLTNSENTYPESQLYNSQEQVYDNMKAPVDAAYPNADDSSYGASYSGKQDPTYDKDATNYDSTYQQDYSNVYSSAYHGNTQNKDSADKYPSYDRETGTSYVYPETDTMEKASRLNDEYGMEESSPSKYGHYEVTGAEALNADSNNKYGGEKLSAKYSKTKTETIERQPEALYRVAGEPDTPLRNAESTVQGMTSQNSWHRIGSPMDYRQLPYLEPGPRSLDLTKGEKKVEILTKNDNQKPETKKRTKRDAESVIQRIGRKRTIRTNDQSDFENEIDFEDSVNIDNLIKKHELSTPEGTTEESVLHTTLSSVSVSTTENPEPTTVPEETTPKEATTESSDQTSTSQNPSSSEDFKDVTQKISTTESSPDVTESNNVDNNQNQLSFLDVLKRLAQFKLRLGLNFLKSTTDAFSKYLDDIQKKVDESMPNTTKYYNFGRNPWARSLFRKRETKNDVVKERSKRSVLNENEFLGFNLRKNDKSNDRFIRETKKEMTKPIKSSQSKKKTLKILYKSKRYE